MVICVQQYSISYIRNFRYQPTTAQNGYHYRYKTTQGPGGSFTNSAQRPEKTADKGIKKIVEEGKVYRVWTAVPL